MARRTIRARYASPYLLYLVIAFAALTVICAVGWGWMYSNKSRVETNTFGIQRLDEAAAAQTDLWQQIFDKYPAEGTTLVDIIEAKDKLANEYRSEIQRLTERIAGDPFSTQRGAELRQSVSDVVKAATDLLAQAGDTLKKSYQVGTEAAGQVQVPTFQTAVRALIQRIDGLVAQVNQDAAAIAQLDGQIRGLQAELQTAKDEHARQVAQLQSQLEDEKKRLTAARDIAVEESNKLNASLQRVTERLIAERRQWNTERDKTQHDTQVLRSNLKDLGEELTSFRKVPTETTAAGRIVRIADQSSVAYADLGKKDGVLLGMTFSIFSPGELGKTEPKPKAQARLVKIMDDSCELRTYQLQSDNPVVVGDILHNPIYDRQRHLRFMLVGKMDIDGDGLDDTEQLKALIQEFGGRVDDKLSAQTDYLVVGEEPAVVSAPAPGAGPMEQQLYEDARKRLIEYTDAKAGAETYSIPILSMNRFLGLVGIAQQR